MNLIPFFSTARQHALLADELGLATIRVLLSNNYILGPELLAFEQAWTQFCGVKYAIGVANGTDAITIALMACDVGVGDEVITAVNTSPYTALAIAAAGATPVFVDIVKGQYSLDVAALTSVYTPRTKAIVPVHLYGQPADIQAVLSFAQVHSLRVIEDACQAHGARVNGQRVGSFGDLGAFSFYPTKNLGALGDAGAITTNSLQLADRIKVLRNYGSEVRYYNEVVGVNSRLDELQAALLLVKLKYMEQITTHKRELANIYLKELKSDFIKPQVNSDYFDVYHIFNIRHPKRDALREYLLKNEIKTEIHYPVAPNKQKAMKGIIDNQITPIAEEIHQTTLSLPISFFHTKETIYKIVETMNSF